MLEGGEEPMTVLSDAILDLRGTAMFLCRTCKRPLTGDDLIAHGLRLPEPDESRDDYLEAELLDDLEHTGCSSLATA
jgi:hypothetical protein